jgi:hypothetical protein
LMTGGVGTVGWQAPEVIALKAQQLQQHDQQQDGGGDHEPSSSSSSSSAPSSSPPSVARLSRTDACAADVFALGCIAFHVLVPGAHIFGEEWWVVHSFLSSCFDLKLTTCLVGMHSCLTLFNPPYLL